MWRETKYKGGQVWTFLEKVDTVSLILIKLAFFSSQNLKFDLKK